MTWFGLILWHVFGVHHVFAERQLGAGVRRVRWMPNGRPYVVVAIVPIFLDGEELPINMTALTWEGGPLARK